MSGSWHLHVLLKKKDGKFPFIDNNQIIEPMWKYGFTSLKRVKQSDHVANYLMAYLSDVKINLPSDDNSKTEKAFVKGARLHYYPTGINIFRRSRGIRNPEKFKDFKKNILNKCNLPQDVEADFAKFKKVKIPKGGEASYTIEIFNDIEQKRTNSNKRHKS